MEDIYDSIDRIQIGLEKKGSNYTWWIKIDLQRSDDTLVWYKNQRNRILW